MAIIQDRLTEILHFKKEFFSKGNINPMDCSFLNQEVAISWQHSRDYGVDPNMHNITKVVSPQEYSGLEEQYRQLIDISNSIFNKALQFSKQHSLILSLIAPSGMFLLRKGKTFNRFIYQKDSKVLFSTERSAGTSAHALAFQLKRPIQLLGVENYRNGYEDTVVACAPLFNSSGEIMAVLGLRQYLPFRLQNSNSYLKDGLLIVTMIASVIEALVKMQQSIDAATESKLLLETVLNLTDNGLLTFDKRGKILYSDKQSARLLGLSETDVTKHTIQYFLTDQSPFLDNVFNGKRVDGEEKFLVNNKLKSYTISARPIMYNGATERVAIKFIEPQKNSITVQEKLNSSPAFSFDDIVGSSIQIRKAINKAASFANSRENVLIIGESGTGKELFAQAIHNASRPNGPFIPINCSALPRDLAISELFGYEGGSFSGAEQKGRPGKIELAHQGTLFLDEIGDMPLELQPILLRVLQDKQIMRVGGQRYKHIDFRLVAATNKNLQELSLGNQFRQDLFFRLSTFAVNLPPLRERKSDIKELCDYFIAKEAKDTTNQPCISQAAMEAIQEYSWPGNVRQLENVILYALNLAQYATIELHHLPDYIINEQKLIPGPSLDVSRIHVDTHRFTIRSYRHLDDEAVLTALKSTNNNIKSAADLLGVARSTIYRKLSALQKN